MSRHIGLGVAVAMHYLLDDIDDGGICHSILMTLENGIPFDGLGTTSPAWMICNKSRQLREVGARVKQCDQIAMFLWAYESMALNTGAKILPPSFEVNLHSSELKNFTSAKHKLMR